MSVDTNDFILTAAGTGAAAAGVLGRFVAPFKMQILGATVASSTAATAEVVLDVNVAGASLYADATRPRLANGASVSAAGTGKPDAKVTRTRDGYADDFESGGVVQMGQVFTVDVDTAGTGATNLHVALHCIKV